MCHIALTMSKKVRHRPDSNRGLVDKVSYSSYKKRQQNAYTPGRGLEATALRLKV